jgi:hypothetical protein
VAQLVQPHFLEGLGARRGQALLRAATCLDLVAQVVEEWCGPSVQSFLAPLGQVLVIQIVGGQLLPPVPHSDRVSCRGVSHGDRFGRLEWAIARQAERGRLSGKSAVSREPIVLAFSAHPDASERAVGSTRAADQRADDEHQLPLGRPVRRSLGARTSRL